MAFLAGTKLGGYEIVGLLGVGGMGEVYRARDRKLERDVAIKTLPPEFSRDSERLARFDREAKVLASLNHPNIAAIYGLEQSGDAPLLVLELVEGETLADRIRRGPIPVDESIGLAIQIVQALEAAHEKGVVHRDLKPANIKVTPEGNVKVLDFGLAKALAEDKTDLSLSNSPTMSMAATAQGIILGTAAYMSPEQAKGRAADRRTDLWAFGCVLYEMLTGRQAWAGETVTDILASVVAREPDWNLLPVHIHPRLEELIRRSLEKSPKKRWHDAGDVRVELETILSDPTGVRARSAVAPTTASKLRLVVPWAMAAFAIAAAGAWMLKPATVTEPRLVTRFDYTLPDPQAFRNTARNVVALSPDGRQFVYNVNGGLYLRSLDTLNARLIPGTEGALTNPFFSPDGQWIGYFQGEQLKKISTSGGAPVVLCDASNLFGASWEEDGTILFGQLDGVWRVSANGGMREQIVRPAAGEQIDGPQLLPGGEWVLFSAAHGADVTRWDTAEIVAQSIQSGDRKILWRGGSGARYVPTGHLVYAVGSTLFAVPFDPGRLEVAGAATPLVEGVLRADPFTGIPATGAANYGVSLTGTLIYVQNSAAAATLGVPAFVDRSGRIERLKLPPNEYRSPRLSPNGRQIALEIVDQNRRGAVWVYDLSGTTQLRRLTQEGTNVHPIWTPDSQHITFASDREGAWGIYWQRADGTGTAERLTIAEKGAQQFPESWSPNGAFLAFVNQQFAGETGSQSLWTLSVKDRSTELFYDAVGTQNGVAFSPNGKWIAYSSNEFRGPMSIFVAPFPPVPGVRYQVTASNETFPLWSRDGRQLFYRASATADRPATVHQVEVRSESPFTFTNEETLPLQGFLAFPNYTNYDLTPDGERVLVVMPADQPTTESARPRIHIVENWFEELNRIR